MKKTLTNTIMGSVAALTLAGAVNAQEVSGNVKYIAPFQGNGSYPEINAFYSLPGNVSGYTFIDRFSDGSYTGKTNLDRKIKENLGLTSQLTHFDKPFTGAGLGLKLNIPVKNGYGSVGFLPAWVDKKGKFQSNQNLATFAFGKDLGNGINFETFGEIDVNDSKVRWSYGEVELTKQVGEHLKIGYCGALLPKGKPMPKVQHRAVVRIEFKLGKK